MHTPDNPQFGEGLYEFVSKIFLFRIFLSSLTDYVFIDQMDYGAVLPPSLMVFFCYICYRYCYCLYSGDVGRSPLLLLTKFSYLRALTASTNLECQDSWKVQHISWLYNAVSDIFSLALSQGWVEFKRNFSKRYFSLVNFKVFKNSKVLKG